MDAFELKHLNIDLQTDLDEKNNLRLSRHTPLLYWKNPQKRNRVEGVATALYVSWAGKKCIISVGHAFKERGYNQIRIWGIDFSLANDSNGIIFLPEKDGIGQNVDYYEMDYAIFFPSPDGIRKIEERYLPFTIPDYVTKEQFSPIWSFICGFPSIRNIQLTMRKPFIARYSTFRLPTYFFSEIGYNYSFERNIAIRFSIDNVISTKNLTRRVFGRAPQPDGLSGSGIWAIPDYPFALGNYSLEGMLTHFDQSKGLFVGFRVQDIVEMIELTYEKAKGFRAEDPSFNICISSVSKTIQEKRQAV